MVEIITNLKLEVLSQYKSDYSSEFHLRELAHKLEKAHTTLIPHLESLEKEKVLTSEKRGRNKVYRINLSNTISYQHVIIAEHHATIQYYHKVYLIMKISEELAKLNLQGCIVLFGSYAKETYKESSDIDLLYIGKLTDKEEQSIQSIGKTYQKKINVKKVKDFDNALQNKDSLIIEVVKYHIILQNHEQFVNALWRYYRAKT